MDITIEEIQTEFIPFKIQLLFKNPTDVDSFRRILLIAGFNEHLNKNERTIVQNLKKLIEHK